MNFRNPIIYRTLMLVMTLFPITSFAKECFQSSILSPSPFMGNNGEIFKVADGSLWEVKFEYEYLYEYSPSVVICPDQGKLIIGDKTLNVQLVSSSAQKGSVTPVSGTSVESQIDGDFEGFEGETIIKLMNGQIWQQSEYHYHYHYAFMPKVIIYKQGGGYKMKVDGVDKSVGVIRIK